MRNFLEIVSGVCLLTCVVGLRQGDFCTVEETGQPGECLLISECPVAYEAALKSISPQTCGYRGTVAIVCCPGAIYEGSNCTMKDTRKAGACTRFANCRVAIDAASKGILPQKCAAGGDLVCCPDPCTSLPQQRSGSKAADYCIELSETLFPCQQTKFGRTRGDECPRLTQGHNATTKFSHNGQIGRGESDTIDWLTSSATLLSDRWVLGSAFIIHSVGAENVKFVGLGGEFTPQYTPDAIYSVTSRLFHPEFNQEHSKIHHSIALLQLDRQVTFTSRIFPVCLHTGFPLPTDDLTVTAWSVMSLTGAFQVTMVTIPYDECSRQYSRLPGGLQDHYQFCSRPVTGRCAGRYNSDTLILQNSARVACTDLLVGTKLSRNIPTCTTLYLRLSAYIPWIESIVWPYLF